MHPLAGVYTAAVTPLKPDHSPDLAAWHDFFAFLAGRGCHGLLLLGTTGEGPSFSPAERTGILRAACRARLSWQAATGGQCRILAGTGTPSLDETISLTRSAFDLGCEGVVVLPPYYFRQASEEGLFRYFQQLIHSAIPSDGYMLGYHIPATAGIGFSPDLLARLLDAFPVQFAGVKDSSHDAAYARLLGERFGSDLLVLTGTDSLLQVALQNGAQGCITALANLFSPLLRQVWEAFKRGEKIDSMQAQLSSYRHILEKALPFAPILKAMLRHLHGLPYWPARPPLDDTPPALLEKVISEMKAAGL